MSDNKTTLPPLVWTKEECTTVVKNCATKDEVQKNYNDAYNTIKSNKWHYLYGGKYLGSELPDSEKAKPVKKKTPKKPSNEELLDFKPGKFITKPKKNKPVAKVYKLKKYQPLSFTLNIGRSKKLLVWDTETERTRAIRHCPNEKSIFVDDQSKDVAVIEPIIFIKGFFNTTEHQGYTQKFLEIHPKFNDLFELVNAEADAAELVNLEDIIIDIKQVIRGKSRTEGGIEELRAVVSVLTSNPGGAATMTPSELRFAAYQTVDTNPNRFIDDDSNIIIFEDADIKRTAIAQQSFLAGIIQVSPNGRQVIWADNKSPICNVPMGLNYMQVFSEFLGTDEGINVSVELTKR